MDNPLIPSVKYATLITTGDGVKTEWEFNFAGGYISPEHVKAFTENVATGELVIRPLTLIGPNTAQITPAVADGLRLIVYRDTPKTEPLVDYSTGSILNESSLDKSNKQAVFIAAELADRVIADYDFSNALLYAVETATAASATANAIDGKAQTALDNSVAAVSTANASAAYVANLTTTAGAPSIGYDNYGSPRTVASMLDQITGGWVNAADPRFLGGIHGPTPMKALQAAHDWAAANYSGSTVYWTPTNGVINCAGPDSLRWDTNRVGLHCSQELSAVSWTGSVFMEFIQSYGNPNARPAYNSVHAIENIIVNGPGRDANSTCFLFNDQSELYTIAGVTIRGGAAWGFKTIAWLRNGAFFTHFENFDFGTSNGFGGSSGVHVYIEGGVTNAGERNVFTNCRWSGRGVFLQLALGPSSTFINGGSMNYNYEGRCVYLAGGSLFMERVHIEGEDDSALSWFEVLGDNSTFYMAHCDIVLAGPKNNASIFNTSVPGAGLTIRDTHVSYSSGMSVPLVSGSGVVRAEAITSYFTSGGIHIGPGANRLYDGGFGKGAAWVNEWTVEPSKPSPVIVNDGHSQAGDAPWSLKFVAGTGTIWHDEVVKPGDMVSLRHYVELTGVTDGQFSAFITFLDRGGNPIAGTGGTCWTLDSTTASGRFKQIGWPQPAPPGAVTARFRFSFLNETGAGRADIDVVEINVF